MDMIFVGRELMEKAREHNESLYMLLVGLNKVVKGLRTLSVGWIDFKKAYDRVPHEWLTSVVDTI